MISCGLDFIYFLVLHIGIPIKIIISGLARIVFHLLGETWRQLGKTIYENLEKT